MRDAVSEIKSRLSIEDLVSQYVVLKRVGSHLKGLCPFHSEKTPSFIVSPERGIAYCFGCHKGGDIFKFLQDLESIDFAEALKTLADRTGVALESQKYQKSIPKNQKTDLFEIHEQVTLFYEDKLWNSLEGAKVVEYLHQRGIHDDTIKKFRLGFAPDSFEETFQILLKKGFDKQTIVLSGLALAKDTSFIQIYDRFRGRLMFPITDSVNRIIAFGGRALKAEQEPKYLNSPETPVYQKGSILYGFSLTKEEIKKAKQAIVVEGYMDLLAAYQNGLKSVVAVSGTALTSKQLNYLKPYITELILAFDMDQAGQEAARRAYDLTLDAPYQVKVLTLPEGKDIAEFAKEHADELPLLLTKAKVFTDYSFQQLLIKYKSGSLSDRKRFLQEFSFFFQQLQSNIEKDEYVRRLATQLNLTEVQVYDELRTLKLTKTHPARNIYFDQAQTENINLPHKYSWEELIIGFMLEHPALFLKFKNLIGDDFFSTDLNTIYNTFLAQYNPSDKDSETNGEAKFSIEFSDLDYSLSEKARLLSLYVCEKYQDFSNELLEKELYKLIFRVISHNLARKKKDLQRKILEAEQNGDMKLMQDLLQQLSSLHFNQ